MIDLRHFRSIIENSENEGTISRSFFERLAAHESIGWDFDNTLIENPYVEDFYQFILDTPEKRHKIVTFRSHGYQDTMFRELRMFEGDPAQDDFDGYVNIPDEMFSDYYDAKLDRKNGLLRGPLTKAENNYRRWKGWVCSTLRLRALVDDNIPDTEPGCAEFGITLYDSINLIVL